MKLLLDTHIVLWCLTDPGTLAATALPVIRQEENPLYCSIASLWEMAVKASLGKLRIPAELFEGLTAARIQLLPILPEHALDVSELPPKHGDPFDRLLVAQARREGMTLVTRDQRLRSYSVSILEG